MAILLTVYLLTVGFYQTIQISLSNKLSTGKLPMVELSLLAPHFFLFNFFFRKKIRLPNFLYRFLKMMNSILWMICFVSKKNTATQIESYLVDKLRGYKNNFLFSDYDNKIQPDWLEIKKVIDALYLLVHICDAEKSLIPKYICKPDKHLWSEIGRDIHLIIKNTPCTYKETSFWKELSEDLRKKFPRVSPEVFL